MGRNKNGASEDRTTVIEHAQTHHNAADNAN